jgi:antitoxin ChpS
MKHEAKLRKVGGSVMLAIPPALLDELELSIGTDVALTAESGGILVQPSSRKRYSLKQLLLEARAVRQRGRDRSWVVGKPKGRELI